MNKSESINELAAALCKAQGEFLPAKMNSVNPFLKNNYADLGSVIMAAKAACTKYGLAVSQPAFVQDGQVTVTTLLMHQSGQWLSSDMTLQLGDDKGRSTAQAAGSIITYLRRYGLSAMLGIYADEDTDGDTSKQIPHPTSRKQSIEDLGFSPKPDNGNGHKPAVPPEVQKALDRVGGDKKRYGDCTEDELNEKVEKLSAALQNVTSAAKQNPILAALDDITTIRKWRAEQLPEAG